MTAILAALADRCEAATGPDRELDLCIHYELRLLPQRHGTVADYIETRAATWCPPFTGSMDAAVTLAPEGWRWMVSNGGAMPGDAPCWAVMANVGETQRAPAEAATPALAMCAAALRAKAAA